MKFFKVASSLCFGVFLIAGCSTDESPFSFKERPTYGLEYRDSTSVLEEVNDIVERDSSASEVSYQKDDATSQIHNPVVLERRTVTVSHIYDGDTIRYFDPTLKKEVTARLLGINAPEYSHKEKQILGKEAAIFLTDLIIGQEIQIEGDSKADVTDRYGRYLVHAFIGGKSIQQILLLEGLVRVAYLYDDYRYTDNYKEAERIAKSAALNIWSIPNYVDHKNGFNMDVIKGVQSLNETISSNTESIAETLPKKLIDKVKFWNKNSENN